LRYDKVDNFYRLQDVLSVDQFLTLYDEFNSQYNTWKFTKNDGGLDHPPMGCIKKPSSIRSSVSTIGDNLTLIKFGSILKYQCEKILRCPLKLKRVNTNIQFFGQEASFHTDGGESTWTLNIFACPYWKTEWGGEFILTTKPNQYYYETYIPNNGILFPAHLDHMGYAPNVLCKVPRLTVAYTYKELTFPSTVV